MLNTDIADTLPPHLDPGHEAARADYVHEILAELAADELAPAPVQVSVLALVTETYNEGLRAGRELAQAEMRRAFGFAR